MERVPDIGPATIELLKNAGITSFADVLRVSECPKGVRADRWAKLKDAAALANHVPHAPRADGNVVTIAKHNWMNLVGYTEAKPKVYYPGRIGPMHVMVAPPYFIRMEFNFFDKDRGVIKRLHSPWYLFNIDMLFFNRRLKITEDGDQGAPAELADLIARTPLPVLALGDMGPSDVKDRVEQLLAELQEVQMIFRS